MPRSKAQRTRLPGMCANYCGREAMKGRAICLFCRETKMRQYWRRVADGICTICGREPAMSDLRTCRECAERRTRTMNRRYKKLRERGMCTRCHHHRARPNRTLCLNCWIKTGQRTLAAQTPL